MTVISIDTVQDLIDEIQAQGGIVGSAWEYTNRMSKTKMFAVFVASQYCDISDSPNVQNPKQIWAEGKFLGEYEHLNSEV